MYPEAQAPSPQQIYDRFVETLTKLQLSSSQLEGSDQAFVFPAFVKPSRSGPVTWRQCCIVRFWHPQDIPASAARGFKGFKGLRGLKERMQLKGFPLFPHALDWRAAMEPVAVRIKGAVQGHGDPDQEQEQQQEQDDGHMPSQPGAQAKRRKAPACPSAAAMDAYTRRMQEAQPGTEAGGDSLTKLAQAMGCNLHWDNLSYWTFAPHGAFLRLGSHSAKELVQAYLGSKEEFCDLWGQGEGAADASGQGSDGPVLNVREVSALAALGHLGEVLSRCVPPIVPPLEQYIRCVVDNEALPPEEREPMVKYMLYKSLRKVPTASMLESVAAAGPSAVAGQGVGAPILTGLATATCLGAGPGVDRGHCGFVKAGGVGAEQESPLSGVEASGTGIAADVRGLAGAAAAGWEVRLQASTGRRAVLLPALTRQAPTAAAPRSAQLAAGGGVGVGALSSLVRQYVDSLFRGRSRLERARLQDLLYLGSPQWAGLHADFKAKGQPFVKTAEVLQWIKSDPGVLSLQQFGVYLVGEGEKEDAEPTSVPTWVDWSSVQWSVDHIVPVKHQGLDHWRNYCLMPQRVNSAFGKHAMAKGGVPKQLVVGEAGYSSALAFHHAWMRLLLEPAAAPALAGPAGAALLPVPQQPSDGGGDGMEGMEVTVGLAAAAALSTSCRAVAVGVGDAPAPAARRRSPWFGSYGLGALRQQHASSGAAATTVAAAADHEVLPPPAACSLPHTAPPVSADSASAAPSGGLCSPQCPPSSQQIAMGSRMTASSSSSSSPASSRSSSLGSSTSTIQQWSWISLKRTVGREQCLMPATHSRTQIWKGGSEGQTRRQGPGQGPRDKACKRQGRTTS